MKKSIILVAVAAFITCSVSVAKADSASEARSVTVQFSDLDTANTQGAATLYRRLRSAAASVCRNLQGKQLEQVWAYTDCVHMALNNAVAKIDRPAVTAYAAAHGMPVVDSTSIRIANNK